MMNLSNKLFRFSVFSGLQLRVLVQIRRSVNVWVQEKGFIKPLPTVEEIAADSGIPMACLNVYIRLRRHVPVLTWRKKLRIREAQRLLLVYPDLPVAVIGEMVGIDDKSNFKRQFAEEVGVPPKAWRDRHVK